MKGVFGEQRLVRSDVGAAQRLLFRLMGVADPSYYLHHRYLHRALDSWGVPPPTRILDAGCDTAEFSFYLARRYAAADVLGVDIAEERIPRDRELARRLGIGNARFDIGDLVSLHRPGEFDLVVCIDVLEHIAEQRVALENLAASLRPDGLAFFHLPTARPRPVPFHRWLDDFRAWSEKEHQAEVLTAEQFRSRVEKTGLEVLESRPTFGYYTGELATSLFALPFRNTPLNRIFQALLAPVCRLLAWADQFGLEQTRYAIAVMARKPGV